MAVLRLRYRSRARLVDLYDRLRERDERASAVYQEACNKKAIELLRAL